MKRIIFTCIALGIFSLNGHAQNHGQDELGSWYMYFGMNKISPKWSVHTELQMRLFEPVGEFNQLLTRVGMNYHINKDAMITAGYGYISTDDYMDDSIKPVMENRIWEQFILKNQVGRVYFEHRYRVEQRWVENLAGDIDYKNRLRYRLMLSVPITKPKLEDNTWYLALYDEIFININQSPFDQNRLYFALGYKISSVWNLQAGYLRHHLKTLDYNRLQFAVFINPDFSKKQ